jgi:hypothetical protein
MLGSTTDNTPELNSARAQEIVALCREDKYFSNSEAPIVPEYIHTVGYMLHCRESFAYLNSGAAVSPSDRTFDSQYIRPCYVSIFYSVAAYAC